MKKILAILLSAFMLLSTCAYAEAADVDMHIVLSDVSLLVNGEETDLTGVSVELDLNGSGARLHIDAGDRTAAELIAGMAGDTTLALRVAGLLSGAEAVYGVDFAVLAENAANMLGALLQSLNPEDMAELMRALQSMDAEEIQGAVEESIAIDGDLQAALEDCIYEITLPFTEEVVADYRLKGEPIALPTGDYDAIYVEIDSDKFVELMNMIYTDGEARNLGDELIEAGVELSMSMIAYDDEHLGGLQMDLNVLTEKDEQTFSIQVTVAPDYDACFITIATLDPETQDWDTGASFALSTGDHDDDWAMPTLDGAVMLTGMSLEAAIAAVQEGATAFVIDAMAVVFTALEANQAE